MPSSRFFRELGLFVRDEFLDAATCARFQSPMRFNEFEKGLVVRSDGTDDVLDEDVRKVLRVKAEAKMRDEVWDAIHGLKPSLEGHFGVTLRSSEPPTFLRYDEGAFYQPHMDGHCDSVAKTRDRRVSIVVFLNAASAELSPNTFGGGELMFYGLLDGLHWEKCGFALNAQPGLLVAFRSDTWHEVRPVTFGQRFTVVTWFRE